MVSSKQLLAVQ